MVRGSLGCSSSRGRLERAHTIDGSASTDHLLPKTTYLKLDREPLNAVAACAGCNNIKGHRDPNTEGGPTLYNADEGTPFTNEMREEFISRAKRHIYAERRRRAETFGEDHKRWLEAVDQWRHTCQLRLAPNSTRQYERYLHRVAEGSLERRRPAPAES